MKWSWSSYNVEVLEKKCSETTLTFGAVMVFIQRNKSTKKCEKKEQKDILPK